MRFFGAPLLVSIFVSAFASAAHLFAAETETLGIGARSTALAGAVSASVNDPSAVYYNPAGLVALDKTQAWFDLTSFSLSGDSNNPDTGESFDFNLDPFILRPTLIVGGKLPWEDWHWAFGVLGVSGLATRFPGDFGENRFSGFSAKILQTTLTPAVGWQATESLSLGVTAEISALTKFSNELRMGDGFVGDLLALGGNPGLSTSDGRDDARVRIDSDKDFPSGLRPHNDLSVDFRSASFVAGGTYELHPRFRVGATYREKSEPTFRGTVEFLFADDVNARTGLPDPKADFETDFAVRPRMVNVGFAWEAIESWILHGEGQWSQWSTNRALRLNLGGEGILGQRALVIPLDWHDTYSPRVGIEKIFTSGRRIWVGYWLDKDPSPDRTYFAPFIPSDIHIFSLGGLLPSLFAEGVDLGIYGQLGIVQPRGLAPGESRNAGGLKRPFFDDAGRLAFGPNDTSIRYENPRLYSVGFTVTIPFEALLGES